MREFLNLKTPALLLIRVGKSDYYDVAMWDQGIRHGEATYFHPNGNKEEATYVEGYEQVFSSVSRNFRKPEWLRRRRRWKIRIRCSSDPHTR